MVPALVGWFQLFVWGAEEKLPSDDVIKYHQTLNVSHVTLDLIIYYNYNQLMMILNNQIRSKNHFSKYK